MMYFKIELDHCIDIITNSSSELFILKGATKELVKEAIKKVYPDYLDEYQEVKSLSDLDHYELDQYLNSSIGYGVGYNVAMTNLIDGFMSNVKWWVCYYHATIWYFFHSFQAITKHKLAISYI